MVECCCERRCEYGRVYAFCLDWYCSGYGCGRGRNKSALFQYGFVVGALCAAVSSLITSSVLVQVIVFIVVTCGTLIATKPLVDKYKKGHKEVKTNSDRFIGQTGVMLTDIDTLEAVGSGKGER